MPFSEGHVLPFPQFSALKLSRESEEQRLLQQQEQGEELQALRQKVQGGDLGLGWGLDLGTRASPFLAVVEGSGLQL